MRSNRALLFVLVLLLFLLLGLVALFVWLTGGLDRASDSETVPAGIVHVRSIYVANGENLRRPVGIGADESGRFYVTLRDAQRVIEFDRSGDWLRSWGERGLGQGQMLVPTGVAVDRAANHVYVADRSRLRLLCYTTEGEFLWEVPVLNPLTPVVLPDGIAVLTFGPIALFSDQGEVRGEVGTRGLERGQFDYPRSAAVLPGGDLVVADSNNNRVQRVKLEGEVTATAVWVDGAPGRFQDDPKVAYGLPTGAASDGRGRVFVLDGFKHEIKVLDGETGDVLHTFSDLQGKSDGRFNLPTAIAYLGGDTFAITDTYNDRVQIVRLLIPGEDNVVRRYPWLWYLIPAALLALLPFFLGRKRWFASRAALERAQEDGHLRLIAGVAGRIHVLPETYELFRDVEEEGVSIGEYLAAAGPERADVGPGSAQGGSEHADDEVHDEVARLDVAVRPHAWRRLLLPRAVLVVRDGEEASEFDEVPARLMTVDELTQMYRIDDTP